MSLFRCGRFPSGEWPIRTSAGIVWFRDGQAEVDADSGLAAALREVPAVFGIIEDGVTEPPTEPPTEPSTETPTGTPEVPERPAQSAVKAAWVDYAVACGADPGEAEALTKPELIERYGSQ
ncbi:hypothetical protein FLW53_23455 [Microbispora sp. SCL1-1]|uniref:hypothetical protein n=1 Tax=unclassified Microbispora TaxID=2614687 RepID=UPI001156C9A8|nr:MULTISPECIES: hypothetical protein [unclassified Microbispora]NJP27102.1 hypothetical protein [Microbispora sp. CL1-1]TQS11447.1 hypothetical protein FLW53_23455 [Microbispora sp. SCL1-1]